MGNPTQNYLTVQVLNHSLWLKIKNRVMIWLIEIEFSIKITKLNSDWCWMYKLSLNNNKDRDWQPDVKYKLNLKKIWIDIILHLFDLFNPRVCYQKRKVHVYRAWDLCSLCPDWYLITFPDIYTYWVIEYLLLLLRALFLPLHTLKLHLGYYIYFHIFICQIISETVFKSDLIE